ncbi:MAG: oligopeptide ABC transporter ATP-binding protein [Thermotoga sp.]|nr:MAG: oligopeptide ABC transporter ATP-binding protein [Thermotoga sp.]
MTQILEVKKLKKYYPIKKIGRRSYVKAVDNISFSVRRGKILGILGESGCGKSTLGRVITRLEMENGGDIFFLGNNISGINYRKIKDFRQKMQVIFQNPYDSFDPRRAIIKSLEIPMKLLNIGQNRRNRIEIIMDAMERAKLTPAYDYLERYPHELSGGQLQRISMLRSMLLKPNFLVADECVSMLDVSVRAEVLNMLLQFRSELETSILFITHDISVAKYMCDRIMVIYAGKVMEIADAKELISNPMHPYTKALISYSPIISPQREKDRFTITGEVVTPIDPPAGCRFASRCPFAKEICYTEDPEMTEISPGHFAACHLID